MKDKLKTYELEEFYFNSYRDLKRSNGLDPNISKNEENLIWINLIIPALKETMIKEDWRNYYDNEYKRNKKSREHTDHDRIKQNKTYSY